MIRKIFEAMEARELSLTPEPQKKTRSEMGNAFLDELKKMVPGEQIMLMGPFIFVGDGEGGVLGKYELSFWPAGSGFAENDDVDTIHIGFVQVEKEHRGAGGNRLMKYLTTAADNLGFALDGDIDPQPYAGERKPPMNKRRLAKYYKHFGFKPVKGQRGHITRDPKIESVDERFAQAVFESIDAMTNTPVTEFGLKWFGLYNQTVGWAKSGGELLKYDNIEAAREAQDQWNYAVPSRQATWEVKPLRSGYKEPGPWDFSVDSVTRESVTEKLNWDPGKTPRSRGVWQKKTTPSSQLRAKSTRATTLGDIKSVLDDQGFTLIGLTQKEFDDEFGEDQFTELVWIKGDKEYSVRVEASGAHDGAAVQTVFLFDEKDEDREQYFEYPTADEFRARLSDLTGGVTESLNEKMPMWKGEPRISTPPSKMSIADEVEKRVGEFGWTLKSSGFNHVVFEHYARDENLVVEYDLDGVRRFLIREPDGEVTEFPATVDEIVHRARGMATDADEWSVEDEE